MVGVSAPQVLLADHLAELPSARIERFTKASVALPPLMLLPSCCSTKRKIPAKPGFFGFLKRFAASTATGIRTPVYGLRLAP
jgi:hypothetical protein